MKVRRFLVAIAVLLTANVVTAQPSLDAEAFEGLEFRSIGPALMSGRIADIPIDPERRSTWYVAVGSGGAWKTMSSGTPWTPGRRIP